jgi:hypothetical protein
MRSATTRWHEPGDHSIATSSHSLTMGFLRLPSFGTECILSTLRLPRRTPIWLFPHAIHYCCRAISIHKRPSQSSNLQKYTVGWIYAVTTEFIAAQAFFNEIYNQLKTITDNNNNNNYTLGKSGSITLLYPSCLNLYIA